VVAAERANQVAQKSSPKDSISRSHGSDEAAASAAAAGRAAGA
jgi:hypothetical protein